MKAISAMMTIAITIALRFDFFVTLLNLQSVYYLHNCLEDFMSRAVCISVAFCAVWREVSFAEPADTSKSNPIRGNLPCFILFLGYFNAVCCQNTCPLAHESVNQSVDCVEVFKPFYEMLATLYKQRSLLDSQKKLFLELIRNNLDNFKNFMGSQSSLFVKACSFYIDELTEEDVRIILEDDSYGFEGTYLLEPDKYTSKVQKAVTTYKNAQKYTQLRKHWNDLTGTDSPYAWSNKYGIPIMAMVPETEVAAARKAFGIINSKSKDAESIAIAEDYISKMSYAADLNNQEKRNKAFADAFLGEYGVLFDDVDEVIDYLRNHTSDAPYHWLGSKEVAGKIKAMANANYMNSGYGKAKKVIDEMPAEQVKEYLKKLIEDNVAVGVEIMKGYN